MDLQTLIDVTSVLIESAAEHAKAISSHADQLDVLRKIIVDTPASRDEEPHKRTLLDNLADCIDNMHAAAQLSVHGTMDVNDFAKEIESLLTVRAEEITASNNACWVRDTLRERANNIAQAYSGRVLREPK